MLSFTAAASAGVPSWKVTPGRMVMVQTVPSALDVTDWARLGCSLRSASNFMSES